MMQPDDAAYWEHWARDLGWDAARIAEAGRVGAAAMGTGMTQAQAMDVVLARVRDGRDVREGLPPGEQFIRQGGLSVVMGMLFLAAVGTWVYGVVDIPFFPIATTLGAIAGASLGLRAWSKRLWVLPSLGIAINLAALALEFVPAR